MVKKIIHFGMAKYVKIAFLTGTGVFPIFCCPGKLFTKLLINPSFSTSTGFMMAYFEAKIHEKTLESHNIYVFKCHMSAMLCHSEVMGKGVTQKSSI